MPTLTRSGDIASVAARCAPRCPTTLDGELDPRTATGVKRHVRWCPSCRRMLTICVERLRVWERCAICRPSRTSRRADLYPADVRAFPNRA